jgi:hypothetical protein
MSSLLRSSTLGQRWPPIQQVISYPPGTCSRVIHEPFRDAMSVDQDTWARGRGWVQSLEVIALPYYRRNPAAVDDAQPLIAELLADFAAQR